MASIKDNPGKGGGSAPSTRPVSRSTPKGPVAAILIADDSPDDALQVRKTIKKLPLPFAVHVVSSGDEVLAYLEGEGLYQERAAYPYPALLLLDLRMPGADGFKVLKWLQTRREHGALPVVVLSVVRDLSMVSRAYQLGARSFLMKPVALDELTRTLRALAIFPDTDTSGG